LLAPPAKAQLWTWTKEQMLQYTKAWTGDRFPDGRPKVPDQWLERAKDTSAEEIAIPKCRRQIGGIIQPVRRRFPRAPSRNENGRPRLHRDVHAHAADLDSVITAELRDRGIPTLNNQYVIDMLQPGDVLVVDLYGKHEGGTIVGDNLFYYIMKATKGGGVVVDGSFRDLDGIGICAMPCYYRYAHPSALTPQTTTVAGSTFPSASATSR
jgi:4-hydroxy-4-methyl-2-oxoglutarate aldolase